MTTSAERIDRHLADSARHHRSAQNSAGAVIALAVIVIVLLFLRGFWPPSESQLQQRDPSGTPAG